MKHTIKHSPINVSTKLAKRKDLLLLKLGQIVRHWCHGGCWETQNPSQDQQLSVFAMLNDSFQLAVQVALYKWGDKEKTSMRTTQLIHHKTNNSEIHGETQSTCSSVNTKLMSSWKQTYAASDTKQDSTAFMSHSFGPGPIMVTGRVFWGIKGTDWIQGKYLLQISYTITLAKALNSFFSFVLLFCWTHQLPTLNPFLTKASICITNFHTLHSIYRGRSFGCAEENV